MFPAGCECGMPRGGYIIVIRRSWCRLDGAAVVCHFYNLYSFRRCCS